MLLFLFIFPTITLAKENQFITIVNPIRISRNNLNPTQSLINQYNLVKAKGLAASWLFTYDTLANPEIIKVIKTMDQNQDIGILMEVTDNSAKSVGIKYNKTDSWHRSTSVFLSGYTQVDRIKFIDTVFNKFKNQLGYYPTSVGAWWIDSYSLEYMQKKYGVNANLVCADQVDTDGYTLWGQFWATPYYPSKNHSAIPAQKNEDKLDVVNMQWAPRDPLNGYISPVPNLRASLYSAQDYSTIKLTDAYLEELINLYAEAKTNNFGQITFGLEGDMPPDFYKIGSQFDKYLMAAKKFSDTGQFLVYNMKQFSNWYKSHFTVSPSNLTESDDLLGKGNKSIWYSTPKYRLGLVIDQSTQKLKIVDLRTYFDNFQEPFYISSNKQLDLFINLPSVIDTGSVSLNSWEISNIRFVNINKNQNGYQLTFNKNRSIDLQKDSIIFSNFKESSPAFVSNSPYLNVNKSFNNFSLNIKNQFPYGISGYTFRDLKIEYSYFLNTKKAKVIILSSILALSFISILIFKFLPRKIGWPTLIFLMILCFSFVGIWYLKNSETYFVSQAELDALYKLKLLPPGKILVLDRSCLQCHFNTKYKIAALSNKRDYIQKFTDKSLVFENKLIESSSIDLTILTQIKREDTKDYLKKLRVNYIYLIKHEDYKESTPYSPGDLGIEQIFVNSDAQIYKLK